MTRAEVSDVLTVGIMRLADGPVPHDSQPRRCGRTRRGQPPEKPELQIVTQITSVTILHRPQYVTAVLAGPQLVESSPE